MYKIVKLLPQLLAFEELEKLGGKEGRWRSGCGGSVGSRVADSCMRHVLGGGGGGSPP